MWAGEETQDGAVSATISEGANSTFENFASEIIAPASGKATVASSVSSKNGYKAPARIPGILRSGDAMAYRNGDAALPHDKAFSIQIGWRLFRLSGASLMSDGGSSVHFGKKVY